MTSWWATGELCGRVGLEEILALGSGLTRDAPHPTPRSRKTEKTHQNVAGGPSLSEEVEHTEQTERTVRRQLGGGMRARVSKSPSDAR